MSISVTVDAKPLVTNNGEDKDNIMDYIERIGPYFFFYALAVVLLIVWIFYCSCCCCPSCCCVQKYEDYYVRNIAFSIAVVGFFLIIGGCFAGFFFKIFLMEDINGVICSFERLYFDIMEGQINLGLPKWPGLNNMSHKLDTLYNVLQTISSTTKNYGPDMSAWDNNENSQLVYVNYEKAIKGLLSIQGKYHYLSDRGNNYSSIIQTDYVGKINFEAFKGFNYYVPTLNELQRTITLLASSGSSLSNLVKSSITDLSSFQGSFSDFKGNVLDDIDDYQGYVEDYGDPALIAIFSILLGFAIIGLFSLFFYVFSIILLS